MADALVLDAEHPWPWLDAFPESAERFFNGRDEEKAALFRCLLSAPVTVLFGKSGLGKSSLLQAGLFPRLREERLLPVYVRLLHDSDAPCASAQIVKRLCEEVYRSRAAAPDSHALNYRYREEVEDRAEAIVFTDDLWAELHRSDIELLDGNGKRWQPVFVLDQFEEIFTLAAQNPARQQQLFYELGDLLENRIPKTLAERLNSDDELFDQLNPDIQPYRFLISLREDYLPDLEEWSELIPRLALNRFRLLPMSRNQAIDAVEKTGGRLVDHNDAENIVRYLSDARVKQAASPHKRRGPGQIEPALLGLMCAGLNDERINAEQAKLKTDDLAQSGGLIVERFYDDALKRLPDTAGEFIEQRLITSDGVRLAYPIRSVANEKSLNQEHLQILLDKRLLRREALESGDRIELVHDRLAQVALQRRLQRQEYLDALKEKRRRLRWLLGGASLILLLTMFAVYMWHAQDKAWQAETKAKNAWMVATGTRLVIEGGSITAGTREGGTMMGLLKVIAGYRLAKAANSGEALLDEVLQTEYLKFLPLKWLRESSALVSSVAFSPDGTHIVSGSYDNTLRLWDAKTGAAIGQPMTGHTAPVHSVAFSPDGNRIVSGSADKTLRLWDAKTGAAIGQPLASHTQEVTSVAFSPDGNRIVSGSYDNTLRLWDAKTGAAIDQPMTGHTAPVHSVAFSPDGNRIVSGSWDNTLRLWDAKTGAAIGQPMTGHTASVHSVAFSPDGKCIVSGSMDTTLRLWNVNTGTAIGQPLIGHSGDVQSVAFSPDGNRIVSGSWDKTLRLWDANTGTSVGQPLTGHTSGVLSVAFSTDGRRIVSCGYDNTLRLWDAQTDIANGQPLIGHTLPVESVAFSRDSSRIVSGSWDATLKLWDAKTGLAIGQPLTGHTERVWAVDFSPDGRRIVSGSEDKTLRLWDAKTGAAIGQPLTGHTESVWSVVFSPDGSRIVSGSEDKTLRLWDAKAGAAIGQPMTGHTASVHSVAFSPDGNRIVSGSMDTTLRLWNANTGTSVGQPLTGHTGPVFSVAFSRDGGRIVSGGDDGELRLWDAKTGAAISHYATGTGSVDTVALSRDGNRIVSGSWDNTLRLWDAKTGAAIGQPLTGHTSGVLSVAFSPDGSRIVSGSYDSTLRLWPVFDGWADELCKKLDRNMSRKEWREWVSPEIAYHEQCPGLPVPADEAEEERAPPANPVEAPS
ncbi:WD40 repeat domain-containing protein [Methylomonas sp. MgM2]